MREIETHTERERERERERKRERKINSPKRQKERIMDRIAVTEVFFYCLFS